MKKQYQCLYEDMSCDKLDSSTLTKIQCCYCEHYGNGVRFSKGLYLPKLKKLLLKLTVISLMIIAIFIILWVFGFICHWIGI